MTNVIWKMENETASMTLNELARLISAEARGDGEIELTGVGPLARARAGEVTYVADVARLEQAGESEAAALIIPMKLADHSALAGRSLLVAKDPKLAFALAIAAFHSKPYKARGVSPDLILGENSRVGADCSIHPRVTIGRDSIVGDRVTLHPGVVIGDGCRVGDDTLIFANVSIYDETEIGARCRIHSGSVIGSDGFSFTPDEEGRQFKLLQVGRVVIGENTVVAALAGFSGGTSVGRNCVIAGQIGTNQHITIGDGATITARTGVTKSVEPGKLMGGMMPAMDYQQWRKSQVLYARLPELFERLKKLERKLSC